jgi:8-amino-7-oxononanoate synthase
MPDPQATHPEPWSRWVNAGLEQLADDELLRDLRPLEPVSAVEVDSTDGRLLLFSSNDYLGLSHHPVVREAVAETVEQQGMGPRGSPLICGYTDRHAELEERLSALKQTEATLLCPTGFSANLAAIASLASDDVAIFSDALNHASIIDGCRLGRRGDATLDVYDHADTADLDRLLADCDRERMLVVTDSVFSMDGDLAPLDDLAAVCDTHDALLMIDEAHATFVHGERGAGVSEKMGVTDAVDVNVGTLSKAFGSLGGFLATSETLRTWFLNRGRSYIFSTAPPLPVVAAAIASLKLVASGDAGRDQLRSNVARVGDALGRDLESPIVPIVLGSESDALDAAEALLEAGIHATAIRPPTVPPGTSRIRIALSAAHTDAHIDRLLDALSGIVPEMMET